MFRVTRYPMISKTESGWVGYRKKYRVAGRVWVPAGHCLCYTSRVGHIIGMCARLIAEHKVESMRGTAQRNAAFGAHSTQASAQYHTEDRQAHKGTHSSKASKQYHRAQKQAHKLAHGMTKQSREGDQEYHSCNSDQASASTQRFTHLLNEE